MSNRSRWDRRSTVRLISWNVNGIRSCVARGFADWLRRCGADVVGLQEMRVTDELLPANLRRSKRYPHFFLSAALGGEYYFVPKFSIGLEGNLGFYSLGDVTGGGDGADGFFTSGLAFLRMYF